MSRLLRFEVPPGKGVLRGHDHFWQVIKDLDRSGPWSVPDVDGMTASVDKKTVRDFVRRLVAGGVVKVVHREPNCVRYRIVRGKASQATPCFRRDGTPGQQGRGQVQMWNLIRGPFGRDGFTSQDLALYASTKNVGVKIASAKSYVKYLHAAGYLHCLRVGKQPATWRLKPAMNTGPKPPIVLRSDIVFDQNRAQAMGPVEGREVSL